VPLLEIFHHLVDNQIGGGGEESGLGQLRPVLPLAFEVGEGELGQFLIRREPPVGFGAAWPSLRARERTVLLRSGMEPGVSRVMRSRRHENTSRGGKSRPPREWSPWSCARLCSA
jgi:hypothetical protein